MTEPVAYMWKTIQGTIVGLEPNDNSDSGGRFGIPLYTAEQLHPRVKMTQAEFDEWKELYYRLNEFSFNVHRMLDEILGSIGVERGIYTKLAKRVYQDDDFMAISKKQSELINLFINYSPDTPEKTIEIVPEKKWFVHKKDFNGDYRFLKISAKDLSFNYKKNKAAYFDTKEEAELWTNPLTEAVQLEVEEER
ncbi:hypothetical protein [Leuconostoc mesenteroides]|uniref:hypothetical protein n=2 Tax=Leuconostoc mesenteroides TaxID=1245 RepID=UPI00235DEC5B|nr:hypothetical protein [Leuconostoc mesenteroides]